MHCTNCGTQIPDGAKFCPNCAQPVDAVPAQPASKRQKMKKKKGSRLVAVLVAVVGVIIILAVALGSGNNDSKPTIDAATSAAPAAPVADAQGSLVYEDDLFKASLVRFEDPSLAGVSVDGLLYIYFNIENKSDHELMITLQDVSLNHYSVGYSLGTPIVVTPGNKSMQPVSVSNSEAGGLKAADITNCQFKFYVMDNASGSVLETTKLISVSTK